jgi:outer membrane receptor for ferrienterochelin and colicins
MKKRQLFKLSAIFFALSLSLFSCFSSLAQEKDVLKDTLTNSVLQLSLDKMDKVAKDKNLLAQTTSTASKTEEKSSDAPSIVEVVEKREIMAFGGNTLGDVLNRLTNFYMASPTHLFNNMTSMRGDLGTTYSSHVLLLLNGRPMRESLFGGLDMAFINTIAIDDIERIEILRGPGSVLYGTGAFTGVINIIMQNQKDTETHINTRLSPNGSKGVTISQAYNKDNFTLHTSLRYFGQYGEGTTYNDVNSVVRTLPLDDQNIGGYVSAEWKKLTIRGYYGVTSAALMNNEQEWSRNFGEFDRTTSKRGFLDAGFKHNFTKAWNMTVNNTINTHNIQFSFYDDYKAKFNTFDNLTEMTHFIKPIKNMDIVVGALYNINSSKDDGSLDENFEPVSLLAEDAILETNYAFYGQINYKLFNRLKLISGLQMNKTSHDENLDFAPRFGAVLNLPYGFGIKTLYGKSFRTPSHFDVDYQGKEFRAEELKSEFVQTTDIQLFIERQKWQFGLTYYNSHQKSIIARENLENEIYAFANQKNVIFQGIEAEGKFVPNSQILFTGNFSYYYSINDEGEEYTSAVPAITTCAGVAYFSKNKAFSAGVYNVYFSKPPDVNELQKGFTPDGKPDEQRLLVNPVPQAFDMISMNVSLDITTAFRLKSMPKTILTLYGENLLDTEVWQPEFFRRKINSVPYQSIGGRVFYLTLGVRF